MNYDAFKYDV